MNEGFRNIYDRLVDPQRTLDEPLEELKHIGDFGDDLLKAMQEQVEAKNWTVVTRLMHVLFLTVDRKFTPLLCDLLDNRNYDGYMEDIADALIDIQDERCIPSIIRALDYYLWWDSDSHFNRKLIVALQNIGSDAAVNGLRLALRSPKELIREDAENALRYLGEL